MLANLLLASLPEEELDRLKPHLTTVDLELGKILVDVDQPIRYVYFPTGALISIVVSTGKGQSTEAGMVGMEGVTAFPDVLADGVAAHHCVVQGAGEAVRLDADIFRREFAECAGLRRAVLSYAKYLMAQVCGTALCNSYHSIDERLAKWLLMCSDAVQANELQLTQEFLATMLGVHRPGVTASAHALREAESIDYTRGRITIKNRRLLESFACDCYRFVSVQRANHLCTLGK